jgi:serine protease Do
MRLRCVHVLMVLLSLGTLVWSAANAQQGALAERAWLGVELQDVSEPTVKALGAEQAHGLLMVLPFRGGPAERAGLRPADVTASVGAPSK